MIPPPEEPRRVDGRRATAEDETARLLSSAAPDPAPISGEASDRILAACLRSVAPSPASPRPALAAALAAVVCLGTAGGRGLEPAAVRERTENRRVSIGGPLSAAVGLPPAAFPGAPIFARPAPPPQQFGRARLVRPLEILPLVAAVPELLAPARETDEPGAAASPLIESSGSPKLTPDPEPGLLVIVEEGPLLPGLEVTCDTGSAAGSAVVEALHFDGPDGAIQARAVVDAAGEELVLTFVPASGESSAGPGSPSGQE